MPRDRPVDMLALFLGIVFIVSNSKTRGGLGNHQFRLSTAVCAGVRRLKHREFDAAAVHVRLMELTVSSYLGSVLLARTSCIVPKLDHRLGRAVLIAERA